MSFTYKTILLIGLLFSFSADSQEPAEKVKSSQVSERKGFYFYWGYNRANFSKSNIHFTGDGHDFTLLGVKAKDRQSKPSLKYLIPKNLTIPQYDYRLGYYLNNGWNVSFGFDHMKYVMESFQDVKIDGLIDPEFNKEYAGTYKNEAFQIEPNFLKLEHTNGLNYINIHVDKAFKAWQSKSNNWNLSTGIGLGTGILYPKSDVTLLDKPRNDEWHLAGFGISALSNLRITFKGLVFLEYNLKGGFIHMPDILTTANENNRASQSFFFLQRFGVLGINFRFNKSEAKL